MLYLIFAQLTPLGKIVHAILHFIFTMANSYTG